MSEEICQQLLFCKDNLSVLNTKYIFELHKCTKIVYSDASSTGFAGYEVSTVNDISHGMWSEEKFLIEILNMERISSCLKYFAVLKPFSHKPASKVVHRQPGGQKYS